MKTALQAITAGKFKLVIERIQKKEIELNTNNAMKLLINCCTVCNKKQHNIPTRDMCVLVNNCCSQINELNETQVTFYLQSVYHILKYLLEKDLSVIVLLEEVLFPKFLPSSFTEKQEYYYGCFSSIIYNSVFSEVKQKKIAENTILIASITSLKFFEKTGAVEQFLDRIYKFLQVFARPAIPYSLVSEFIEKSVDILKKFQNAQKSDVVFRSLLRFIRLFMKEYEHNFKNEELQKLVEIVLKACKEFCERKEQQILLDILTVISIFISDVPNVEDLQNSSKNLKSAVHIFGLTENSYTVCQTISTIFIRWCRVSDKSVDKFWNKKFTVQLQLVLYKLLKRAAGFIGKMKNKCSCSENCDIESDINGSVNLLYVIVFMFRVSLSKEVKSVELLKTVVSYLETNCSQIVTLKNAGCINWKSLWQHIGNIFYNICVLLYNSGDTEVLLYHQVFIRFLIALEGTTTSMIKDNALDTICICFVEHCIKIKDYMQAMKMASFRIFLSPKDTNDALVQWIRAKSALKDNQNITIFDMLEKNEADFKKLFVEFTLDKNIKADVLILELKVYKKRWPSKVSMLSAFKQLYSCVSASKAARVFVKIWAIYTHSFAEELVEVLQNLINDYKASINADDFESSVLLACLYFCLYKYKTESDVTKNSAELKKNVVLIKRPLPPYEGSVDPNDECDVDLSSFLTCESQMKTMLFLNKSLEIFEKNCNDVNEKQMDFMKSFEICDVLLYIGYEYQLHCYSEYCKRLWRLVLKIAEKLDDILLIINAEIGLMESGNGRTYNNYAQLAKKVLNDYEDSAKKWETLTDFYLALSQWMLDNQNPYKGYRCFQLAQGFYDRLLTFTQNERLRAYISYMDFKFVLFPCNLKIVDHNKEGIVKIHEAYKVIVDHYRNPGDTLPNVISLLFEITYTCGSFYRSMLLPREVRCYLREVAVLAQQLVSPLWATRFLILLAHADLLTCRNSDCKTKIFGISTILCIPQHDRMEERKGDGDVKIMNSLCDELEELSLDLQQPRGSPTFDTVVKPTFQYPKCFGHKSDCNKFCCQLHSYQELIAMKAHLDAVFSIQNNSSSNEIQKYFDGALYLVKNFEKRSRNFWQIHSNIFLDYGNLFLATHQKKTAAKINNELLEIIYNKRYSDIYLYNAAKKQKSDIAWNYTPSNQFVVKIDCNNDDDGEEVVEANAISPKTPEMKVSKVKIEKSITPSNSPLPQYHYVKKLNFNISEDTPIKTQYLTVSSTKIHAPEIGTVKKKRPATATKFKNTSEATSSLAVERTPADSVKAEKLRAKTKLLTEKIKKGAKDDGGRSIRKNLTSELGATSSKEKSHKVDDTKKCRRNLQI